MHRVRRALKVGQGWRGKGTRAPPGLPPGPRPLPFLGNALQVDTKNFPRSVEKLSQRYGPVFTLYLGSQRAVVLFGQEVVQEALGPRGEDFGGRGGSPILDKTIGGTGIGFSNGETWRQLRRFAEETLRELEAPTEAWIQEEAAFLAERLHSTEGRPLNPSQLLTAASTNVLCAVSFGSRFDYQDPEFLAFLHLLGENARLQTRPMTQLYNVFPALLDPLPGSHQTIFRNTKEMDRFIARRAEAQKEALPPGPARNFIHAFLLKMEQEEKQQHGEGGPASVFDLRSLVRSTIDFFVAGAASTSLVLQYLMLVLLKYPEVQEKVHQEIERVIGPLRRPCLADLAEMPYTHAVIREAHRSLALVPLNVPRATTQDTLFRQFLIPKGTTIFPALKPSLHDPREFPHPERFDPAHFLDEAGALRESEFFIPFSIGQRACLGRRLASTTLFVSLATLLQRFRLHPALPPEELDLSPATGFLTVAPKPFQVCLLPR
nr:cytochrome P450 2H1-like [Anolis sagrei ordinatus]